MIYLISLSITFCRHEHLPLRRQYARRLSRQFDNKVSTHDEDWNNDFAETATKNYAFRLTRASLTPFVMRALCETAETSLISSINIETAHYHTIWLTDKYRYTETGMSFFIFTPYRHIKWLMKAKKSVKSANDISILDLLRKYIIHIRRYEARQKLL